MTATGEVDRRMSETDDRNFDMAFSVPVSANDARPFVIEHPPLVDRIIMALRTVYDPEIPVNIYDLGLIYRIEVQAEQLVEIDMTLTAPGCPVAGEMLNGVRSAVRDVDGVGQVTVNLVFDPPWDQSRMSDDAKLELGFL
jgi:FeS assembly SUF system protein